MYEMKKKKKGMFLGNQCFPGNVLSIHTVVISVLYIISNIYVHVLAI